MLLIAYYVHVAIRTILKKTDRVFVTRLHEHSSRENQPMHQLLLKCENVMDIVN